MPPTRPPALLTLPDDAACVLASLLHRYDLERLTSVNRGATRSSYYQQSRDARLALLTLPLTQGDSGTKNRCLRLLQAIHERNPERLTSFQWIQVAAPWQVKQILHDEAIAERITSIRVRATDARDATVVTEVCERLCDLPNLYKLDMSANPVVDVTTIARMVQLRELNLGQTTVRTISMLSALTELRVLMLEETCVTDLSCIQSMPRLEVLKVSPTSNPKLRGNDRGKIFVPSLASNRHLHTLSLRGCIVEGTEDILHIAGSLRHLHFDDVECRVYTPIDKNTWPQRDVHEDELLEKLQRLETIEVNGGYGSVLNLTTSALAKIPSLRVIKSSVSFDLHLLDALVNLEEVHVHLPEGDDSGFMDRDSEDFAVLLRLPRLRKVKITQTVLLPWHWLPDYEEPHEELVRSHALTLADVLANMSSLRSLDYSASIADGQLLPAIHHLEHLTLSGWRLSLPGFDWLRSFRWLRSLNVPLPVTGCDLTPITELPSLESLTLSNWKTSRESQWGDHHQVLSRLTHLKALDIDGDVYDLSFLSTLINLESLTIRNPYLDTAEPIRSLARLQVLDLHDTNVRDLSFLTALQHLRRVAIYEKADCRPLVTAGGPPKLVRVLHAARNCIPRCHWREVLDRREFESRTAVHDSDQDKAQILFGEDAADY